MRLDLEPPRTVLPRPGEHGAAWAPWLAVAVLARVGVAAWEYAETTWLHRALALAGDGSPAGEASPFDPALRAAAPGEPPPDRRTCSPPQLGRHEADALVAAVLAGWRPLLHRHAELALVSRLDEPVDDFRRRCLAPLRPLVGRLGGPPPASLAARLAALARGIETMELGSGHIEAQVARVGVVWYPAGVAPAPAAADAMIAGTVRERR